jgi:hypothetical protein
VQQLDTAPYMLDLNSEQFSFVLLVWCHNLEGPAYASEPVKWVRVGTGGPRLREYVRTRTGPQRRFLGKGASGSDERADGDEDGVG